MSLVKAVRGALTHQPARETSNGTLATIGMATSVKTLDAVAAGSLTNARAIAAAVPVINGKRFDQNAVNTLVQKLGNVVANEKELARLVPVVTEAAKAYEKSEQHRGKMATAIGQAHQKVAVLNSATQRNLYNSHADAAVQVTLNQSAYSNFAV